MLVNDILSDAREQTHVTATQFPDSTFIKKLNLIYKKVLRKIMTEADENYFTTYKEIDAVAAQDSYALGTNVVYVKQVKVLPTSTAVDYQVSTEIDFSKQQYDFEYYASNQPTSTYRHQVTGTNMLLLAPRFTTSTAGSAGNNQIYVTYEEAQADLAVGGAESTVKVPVDYHYVLVSGLKPYIYSALGKTGEKNDAIVEFEKDMNDMCYFLRGRDDTANFISVPNDITLE